MVFNQGKRNFMCLGRNTEKETFVFKNNITKNCEKQKFLEIIIDNTLNFKSHNKIKALARLSRFSIELNIQIGNKI